MRGTRKGESKNMSHLSKTRKREKRVSWALFWLGGDDGNLEKSQSFNNSCVFVSS